MDEQYWSNLPPEFETRVYRKRNLDLAFMPGSMLSAHYERRGRERGRVANRLRNRNDFVRLIPQDASALEIGPFWHPLLINRPNVYNFDLLPQETLRERARALGVDPDGVPPIHYVSETGDLSVIDRKFDVVFSSHVLEHQYDLIAHLQGVGRLLNPGGAYFLMVPDKRYCFDHFIPESSLAEIVIAHREQRAGASLRNMIEVRVLTTHNDCVRHWAGDHGDIFGAFGPRLDAAEKDFVAFNGAYFDTHCWYFSSTNARTIFDTLHVAGLSPLGVFRLYPTRYNAGEFWMILRP